MHATAPATVPPMSEGRECLSGRSRVSVGGDRPGLRPPLGARAVALLPGAALALLDDDPLEVPVAFETSHSVPSNTSMAGSRAIRSRR
jgi:hypothetical protein